VSPSKERRLRLVLYSGGQQKRNALIHESLLELALRGPARRPGRRVRMTYVPYTHEGAGAYFRQFERRYRKFGGTHFQCLPVDAPGQIDDPAVRRKAIKQLLDSDIVYLAGGNTYHFLAHLRGSGFLKALGQFAWRGGVVAGLSAGAHLLTPHIRLAGYPDFDCDSNDIGLGPRSLSALDLVNFEFFPHYRHSSRYRLALQRYSRFSNRPLYACRDGSGIVIEGDCFTAHGDVWLFDEGYVGKIGP
jgi:dipeptidase E